MSWIALTTEDAWFRIANKNFRVGEEVRYDIPTSFANAVMYTGLSGLGTSVNATEWVIVREEFDANGLPTRKQALTYVAWSNRSSAPWA